MSTPAAFPYDDALRERVRGNLAAHARREVPVGELRHAAVAVVLVDSRAGEDLVDEHGGISDIRRIPGGTHGLDGRMVGVAGGAAFVLCRRTSRLRAHAGQWALPGGRLDPGEGVVEAALRELDEELGVVLRPSTVVGLLDDYPTRSGYVITPVVLWADGELDLRPHPGEVVAAYRVGLHQLYRDGSPRFVSIPQSARQVVQVPLGGDLVHAPTGAVLVQLRWLALEGRGDSVQEFEQPVFAWV